MTTHKLQLAAEPFDTIRAGKKTIESRLYDDKRRLIELGDTLIFANREFEGQTIQARVIGLLRYESFDALFTHNDSMKFGGDSVSWLVSQINEFYSEAEQHKDGVLGIEFEAIG